MKISVHLSFNGTCEEAFALYARVLNGTVLYSLRYRDAPIEDPVPADWQDKLYHATLTIGDITVVGGDPLPADYRAPYGFSLVVNPDTADDARRIFEALAVGGVVQMPIQQTFWSSAFGVVTDRFGVAWMINCEQVPAAT